MSDIKQNTSQLRLIPRHVFFGFSFYLTPFKSMSNVTVFE